MEYFNWDPSLDVQISQMNEEHKTLIGYMNSLYRNYQEQQPAAITANSFDALYDYTKEHFEDEEKYLLSHNYPAFDTHKRLHDDLLQRLDQFRNRFRDSEEIDKQFFPFLKSWLSSHIKVVDSQYGEYIVKNTKKAS